MAKATELFRQYLETWIKKEDLSQAAAGKILGITQAQVNEYIQGKREPNLSTLERFSKALGLTVAEMLTGEVAPVPRVRNPEPLEALKIVEKALKQKASDQSPADPLIEIIQSIPQNRREDVLKMLKAYLGNQAKSRSTSQG